MRIAIHPFRREMKLALLVALVAGLGAVGINYGLRGTGVLLCAVAAGIVAAFAGPPGVTRPRAARATAAPATASNRTGLLSFSRDDSNILDSFS